MGAEGGAWEQRGGDTGVPDPAVPLPPSQALGNAAEFEKQQQQQQREAAAEASGGAAAPPLSRYLTFGDGGAVDVAPLLTAAAVADEFGVDIAVRRAAAAFASCYCCCCAASAGDARTRAPPTPPLPPQWQQGDVALLDNMTVMHARRCARRAEAGLAG